MWVGKKTRICPAKVTGRVWVLPAGGNLHTHLQPAGAKPSGPVSITHIAIPTIEAFHLIFQYIKISIG